jgi:hypothetical protein
MVVAKSVFQGERLRVERDAYELTAYKILMYLYENENAKDPLNHVVDYWVKLRDKEYIADRVEKVIHDLVAKDVVRKVELAGRDSYKLNPDKREEVLTLMNLLRPVTNN